MLPATVRLTRIDAYGVAGELTIKNSRFWDIEEPARQTAAVPKSAFTRRQAKFRALLVQARQAADLTQTALATKLGRPQSFVSKFERGERRLDVVEFLDVAAALGLDPRQVIDDLER